MKALDSTTIAKAIKLGLAQFYTDECYGRYSFLLESLKRAHRSLEILTTLKLIKSPRGLENQIDVQNYKNYVDARSRFKGLRIGIVLGWQILAIIIINIYPQFGLMFYLIGFIILSILLLIFLAYVANIGRNPVIDESLAAATQMINEIYEQRNFGINYQYKSTNNLIFNVTP